MKIAASIYKSLCKKNLSMTEEEILMRNHVIQKDEEFIIYKEIFSNKTKVFSNKIRNVNIDEMITFLFVLVKLIK